MLYILHEHATGYALFHVQEVEEIGALLPTVEKAITDVSLFKSAVKLVAFSPFKSGTNALDNVNAVSEGIVHDDLKLFLETNVPSGKKAKSSNIELGVSDPRISATIQDELGIKCAGGDAITEIFRGLRLHFSGIVKGLTPLSEAKAQLGLGHSYSRAKVKFNVHRVDNMIIQSIALLDQLDKDINTFSMRVKEWYSYHFPELLKVINDNYMYCRMVKLIKSRKNLLNADEEMIEKMEEITMDSAKVKAVIEGAKVSMGMDISPIDLINIESFSTRVVSLTNYRKSLVTYLHDRMTSVAPNLSSLIGDMVGARLISHAGSLTNLAKYPASTVQILGAEKALFRALKTKGNTPKYGLIFHSTFIGRAEAKNKGRISRFLANKCSIASRIDCFTEKPSSVFGEKLKEQVEERLKFFETGDTPRKNVDVMKEALDEFSLIPDPDEDALPKPIAVTEEKKKKKKKKRKSGADESMIEKITDEGETPAKKPKTENSPTSEKKKKKKKKSEGKEDADVTMEDSYLNESELSAVVNEKKKKKKKSADVTMDESMTTKSADETMDVSMTTGDESVLVSDQVKKKKKKKNKHSESLIDDSVNENAENTLETEDVSTEGKVKKKKKKAKQNESLLEITVDENTETPGKTKKKKKKSMGKVDEVVKVNGSSHESADGDTNSAEKKVLESLNVGDESLNTSKKMKKKKKKFAAAE